MNDLHIAIDAFIVLIIMEALIKPVAIRLGQAALAYADRHFSWVPDWLHRGGKE